MSTVRTTTPTQYAMALSALTVAGLLLVYLPFGVDSLFWAAAILLAGLMVVTA